MREEVEVEVDVDVESRPPRSWWQTVSLDALLDVEEEVDDWQTDSWSLDSYRDESTLRTDLDRGRLPAHAATWRVIC